MPSTSRARAQRPLWDHQRDAVNALVRALGSGGRATAVMACGSGKTRVAAETSIHLAPQGSVLVLVPTLELLYQTIREYQSFLDAGIGTTVAVCSVDAASHHSTVMSAELRHLARGGIQVTTDAAVLASALASPGRATVVSTYHSLPAIAEAHAKHHLRPWELVVADEAHRTAGEAGRSWGAVHDDEHVPARHRLYMTATPRIYGGEQAATVSMDDTAVFGPEAYRLSFRSAIDQSLLADYRVIVSTVAQDDIEHLAAHSDIVSVRGRMLPWRMWAAQIALARAVDEFGLNRIITYHQSVDAAGRFAGTLSANTGERVKIQPHLIHGGMSLDQRSRVLATLEAADTDPVVVANCRVLSEGVDVPELDAVMFCDPRDSGTDVVQAIGRALRRGSRADKLATIIIPVLIRPDESPDTVLSDGRWSMVWRIIRALASHDERLADELTRQRALYGSRRHRSSRVPHLPPWLQVSGADTLADSLAASIGLRILQMKQLGWQANYLRAQEHYTVHGHLDLPSVLPDGGRNDLADWLNNQRQYRANGSLSDERVAALDALGVDWDLKKAIAGDQMVAAVRRFHESRGHLDIAVHDVDEHGDPVGAWIRAIRRRGPKPRTAADLQTLESIQFCWSAKDARGRIITGCEVFFAQHGHLDIPQDFVDPASGARLAAWLADLAAGRVWTFGEETERLARLGLQPVRERFAADWRRLIARFERYRNIHGNLTVPTDYSDDDGFKLGRTLQKVRSQKRHGKLRPDQIEDLEALGIVWEPQTARFAQLLDACDRFLAAHGSLDFPNSYVDGTGYPLGVRLDYYRRVAPLTDEQRSELERRGVDCSRSRQHPRT